MQAALHLLSVLVGVVAWGILAAAIGTIAIFWWLLHTWDEADKKARK